MIVALQTAIAFTALMLAWLFLSLPFASSYLLQAFAVAIVLFIVTNTISRKKKRPLQNAPEQDAKHSLLRSLESACAGLAIFLLIGGTGGLASMWLPLFFVYLFFATFANQTPVTVLIALVGTGFLYYFTPAFGPAYYGNILSIIIFTPIAIFAEKYHAQAIIKNWHLQQERDKVAYYNLYAEKQRDALLTSGAQGTSSSANPATDLGAFMQHLITQIDDLQKESRFSENQLVISAKLTKIGLSLRQALKKGLTP